MSKNIDEKAPIQKGEEVKIKEEYKVLGWNAKGKTGVYIESQSSGKDLIYFPEVEGWGEVSSSKYERVSPGKISDQNKAFISRVRKLNFTC